MGFQLNLSRTKRYSGGLDLAIGIRGMKWEELEHVDKRGSVN